jgi:glyoxylase-like metal-dependent hydrolase (beta-lactamase superfamily II)
MRFFAIEGNRQRLDGGSMYGNAPRALWEGWSPPDARNRIELACRALLVELDDGRRVLFEAGIGVFFEPKLRDRFGVTESSHRLLKNLAEHGIASESIDAVVLSHLHFDHAGGLLTAFEDGPPSLVFPNAAVYVGRRHWERAKHPHPRDRASFIPVLHELLEQSGRLRLVDDDPTSFPPGVAAVHWSDGHTPGLLCAEVRTPGGPIVFGSDLVPGVPWVHVPITMGYDRFPEGLVDEKAKLFDDIVARGGALFLTHDPGQPLARVVRVEGGHFQGIPVPLDVALGIREN